MILFCREYRREIESFFFLVDIDPDHARLNEQLETSNAVRMVHESGVSVCTGERVECVHW